MYAVFKTGGKQYRASTGDVIKVEKIEAEKGATLELDKVLMVGEGEDVKIGTPFLEGGKVTALVLEHGRIAVDDNRNTSLPDVWAGGDCINGGEDLTVSAVQDGKLAAIDIDRFLRRQNGLKNGSGE